VPSEALRLVVSVLPKRMTVPAAMVLLPLTQR
jgi:hypothetical protein